MRWAKKCFFYNFSYGN